MSNLSRAFITGMAAAIALLAATPQAWAQG
jgi:hypothetical protein